MLPFFAGVHGSHALQRLPYWVPHLMLWPDPAHTLANEVKGMIEGITGLAYQGDRLLAIAKYELDVNGRWEQHLKAMVDAAAEKQQRKE